MLRCRSRWVRRDIRAVELEEPPAASRPFKTSTELLGAARQLFAARAKLSHRQEQVREDRGKAGAGIMQEMRLAERYIRGWSRFLHGSFNRSAGLELCRRCNASRLSRIDREVVLLLVLERLGMLRVDTQWPDMSELLGLSEAGMLRGFRSISDEGRLRRREFIGYDDETEDLVERHLVLDPVLVDCAIRDSCDREPGKAPRSEAELYERLYAMNCLLAKKREQVNYVRRGMGRALREYYKLGRRIKQVSDELCAAARQRPRWPLSRLLLREELKGSWVRQLVVYALLGKELRHFEDENAMFTGDGLAMIAAGNIGAEEQVLRALAPGAPLVERQLVQPCGGNAPLVDGDPESLRSVQFELTEECLEQLGRKVRRKKGRLEDVRAPKLRLDQLVLSPGVKNALGMALAQAGNSKALLDGWGLGKSIAYGRAVTMLFTGPPGVGKTACAEALAHELGRPILVADYAQIQNCFVGQTEKNIARAFRTAQRHGAVLFWDEADAMFFSRDAASYSWEVRDINVLLQELEKFDGVCVLATNRVTSLDPALERRISIKVLFDAPDRAMRRQIWRKLIPGQMPLEPDVDLDKLAATPLTGGEMKNVVLNAARIALARGPESRVGMGDFARAIELEQSGSWKRGAAKCIGFGGGA